MATKTTPKIESNIYKKIFDLQSEIGAISKEADNPFFKSKYFDINSLIKQLHPLLIKNKLVLLQPLVDGTVKSIISDLDGNSVESSLELPTIEDILLHHFLVFRLKMMMEIKHLVFLLTTNHL